MLKRLRSAGYAGIIGLEAFSSGAVSPEIGRGIGIWRDLFSNGDEVATQGTALLRRKGFPDVNRHHEDR